MSKVTKEQIISSIEQRIKDEHRKHSHSIEEWPKIAAHKIYATFDIKVKEEVTQLDNRNQITIESLNKEYVLEDSISKSGTTISFCKGMKFKVTKIKNKEVTIKFISPIEDCAEAIESMASIIVKGTQRTINSLDKVIKVWTDEADKFEKDKNSFWNKKDTGGHTINTGYPVPTDHPDKGDSFSPDAIKTWDYKHKGDKKNSYSYQSGKNEWYSKATYEFIRLRELRDLKEWTELKPSKRKYVYNSFLKKTYTFNIESFNRKKFKLVK